jgi:hypothetical protein
MEMASWEYYDKISELVAALPATSEKACYGTPGFYVGKKLFARLKEDGATLVVYNDKRDEWIASNPEICFITDHYKDHPMLLIDLEKVKQSLLATLLKKSWELRATAVIRK